MRNLDANTQRIIQQIPRDKFSVAPENSELLSNRSFPSTMVVRTLLANLPTLSGQENVLLIGVGTGYLAVILARLVSSLYVIEHDPRISAIAQTNLAPFSTNNLKVLKGEGDAGLPHCAPFDYIIALCELSQPRHLLKQVADTGAVVCLEDCSGQEATLVAYRQDRHHDAKRHPLIRLDFSRTTAEVLIDLGVIDDQVAEQASAEAIQHNKPVLHVLQRHARLEDRALYRALAQRLNLRFAEADDLFKHLDKSLFAHFSHAYLDHHRLLPIEQKEDRLTVATDDPDTAVDSLEQLYPCSGVDKLLVSRADFRRLWSTLTLTDSAKTLDSNALTLRTQSNANELGAISTDHISTRISSHLVALYEAILFDAVTQRASDVHLEIYYQRVRVRLRIDGELYDLPQYLLSVRELAGLINVIKTRAQMNIAERRLPQSGRSRLKIGSTSYDLRIQTQPALHGEHAVIRLLPQTGRALAIDQLGLSSRLQRHFRRLLNNPAGLFLIVGPTGSGKTTTLSAGLQELADDGHRKVITVEDPIEYAIDNIQQTRVRSNIGYHFADAMRSFVRQDPDVILVGEIRDTETALEAIRASQTGHLVMSTVHCNDTVDAIQRLVDLGMHPNSLASELLAIMAQRLAKRICPHCRTEAEPDPQILRELFPERTPNSFRCYTGSGCEHCNGRGTHGRIAVVEYLLINSDLRDVISQQPSIGELRWRALDAGMVTLRDSALELVLQGIIALDELPRILPEERMAPELRGGDRGKP